jgi:hypothetical protein
MLAKPPKFLILEPTLDSFGEYCFPIQIPSHSYPLHQLLLVSKTSTPGEYGRLTSLNSGEDLLRNNHFRITVYLHRVSF